MVHRVAFGVFWVFARTDSVSREARVRAWASYMYCFLERENDPERELC
mgnify:CR=1 FL=1